MEIFYTKKLFIRRLPENLDDSHKNYFHQIQKYECPALTVYQFDQINLLPDGTLFKWIIPLKLSFLFFRRRLQMHNIKGIISIRLNWKKRKLRSQNFYLVIHDAWTQNYYHWITQALPRLILAQQTNKQFTLVLPDHHQSSFHLASLNLLNVNSWETIERGKRYYEINDLLYPTHDIQIGDYNDDLITVLRDKLRITPSSSPFKKIFIRRVLQEKRRIVNEDEVLNTFLSFEFEIVEFETLSFAEQLQLLSNTGILAGVHGAGLTNMIFMPDQSTVFELTTRVNGENYYYYSLSNTLSHKYYYQVCAAEKDEVVQEANLFVNIKKLKHNLTIMLAQ
jgi:capsular polysaccharide biosynthesis protein